MIPERRPVSRALVQLLKDYLNAPVGYGMAPVIGDANESVEDYPYCIIYPMYSTDFWGTPFMYPESETSFDYQITSVGLSMEQADFLADKVRGILVRRDSTGDFEVSLSVQNHVVHDRMIIDSSGPRREGQLVNAVDTYRIKVGKQ